MGLATKFTIAPLVRGLALALAMLPLVAQAAAPRPQSQDDIFLAARDAARAGDNARLAKFATTLEKVCVDTVEQGFMTKDLALLVGPDQKWLTTEGFLDKVDENLKKAMA